MKKLNIKRYLQEPAQCPIASSATIANYYNNNIDYSLAKKITFDNNIVKDLSDGFDDGEIGLLLNYLGFQKVTFLTSNMYCFDYSWNKLSKNKLLQQMKEAKNKIDVDNRDTIKSLYRWLKRSKFDNNIIIDYNFGKSIRNFLRVGKPVLLTFNWSLFFKFAKENDKKIDPIKGYCLYHVVVAHGYNKKNIYICDSHHEFYKYKLKKYRKGFYSISWENLMTIMGYGYIFLADQYNPEIVKKYFK